MCRQIRPLVHEKMMARGGASDSTLPFPHSVGRHPCCYSFFQDGVQQLVDIYQQGYDPQAMTHSVDTANVLIKEVEYAWPQSLFNWDVAVKGKRCLESCPGFAPGIYGKLSQD